LRCWGFPFPFGGVETWPLRCLGRMQHRRSQSGIFPKK
jgi:hypothetical protein